ncbi:hypothetical protein M1349_04425, partial [Patescibacteria group bacterium]|nr:hypothetical protein [Patescibacteria group bacterium]
MKTFFGTLIAVVVILFSNIPVFAAVQLSVSDTPLSIDQSNDFEVLVSLLCTGCSSDSYLRGVFYSSGSNYFGYSKNNDGNWSNATGGGCTSYFKISSSDLSKEGTWSGKLRVKPDIENPFYNGSGEYLFKVGRYTPSCGSPTWSSEKTITITGPTPVPTNSPVSTNAPTNIPTIAPTIKPILTIKPTIKITPTIGIKASNKDKKEIILKTKKDKDKPSP